ncbi:cell division protein ZapA [Microvenator marinus]|uniref:cell division protein ZapA n=1 Tax=Microvenator marinus TaxID=2600177 RepID=UPI00201B5EB8|nr:cell division protein ZapA [Microvenator marinus]
MNQRVQRQGNVSQTVTSVAPKSVAVEIRGQKFAVKTDKEAAHVERLAKFVDSKAAEIQAAAPGVPTERLMMLVGMMIAEEYFEAKTSLDRTKAELQRGVDACLEALAAVEAEE